MSRAFAGFAAGLSALLCLAAGTALAQSSSDYSTSGSSINSDIVAAGRSALAQDALRRRNAERGNTPDASGPEVNVQIAFPSDQRGLDNIMAVMLEPDRPGANECQAIAQVDPARNRVTGLFLARKDVRRDFSYTVVVSDSRGGKYPVGHIRTGARAEQSFDLAAPELTPASPQYGDAGTPAARHRSKTGDTMPEPWMMGIKIVTLTPELLKASGRPDSAMRGAVVMDVMPGSPAERFGVMRGDVILRINGVAVETAEQLVSYAGDRREGRATDLYLFSQRIGRFTTLHIPVDGISEAHDTDYVAPQSSGDYIAPTVGPGYERPAADDSRDDDAGKGSAGFKSPAVGPGYVPPGGN